jgi:hypothetical protein
MIFCTSQGAQMAKKAKAKSKSKAAAKKKKTTKRAVPPSRNRIKSVVAVANLQPPGPHHLHVRARIEVPTPGYRAHLKKAVPQGTNPTILILDVVLTKLPGIWPQHVTEIDANYDDNHYTGDFKQVTVRYGRDTKTVKVQIVV